MQIGFIKQWSTWKGSNGPMASSYVKFADGSEGYLSVPEDVQQIMDNLLAAGGNPPDFPLISKGYNDKVKAVKYSMNLKEFNKMFKTQNNGQQQNNSYGGQPDYQPAVASAPQYQNQAPAQTQYTAQQAPAQQSGQWQSEDYWKAKFELDKHREAETQKNVYRSYYMRLMEQCVKAQTDRVNGFAEVSEDEVSKAVQRGIQDAGQLYTLMLKQMKVGSAPLAKPQPVEQVAPASVDDLFNTDDLPF